MYKSAHEEFFDFILKSHLHDTKLGLKKDNRSEKNKNDANVLKTPIKNSEINDENSFTSNKYKKKDKKSVLSQDEQSLEKNEISKTTNELIKELAQTVKEGQSLQKDVEVLKKVVLEQNFKLGQNYIYPNSFELLKIPEFISEDSQFTMFPNNSNKNENKNSSSNIDNYFNYTTFNSVPIAPINSFLLNNIQKYFSKKAIDSIDIEKFSKKIVNIRNIQELMRASFQNLKTEVIHHFEQGNEIVGKLSGEIKMLNIIKNEQDNKIKEKKILVNKLNDSINFLKIKNKELSDKYNIVSDKKEIMEKEMKEKLLELEKENAKLRISSEKMEEKYEQVIFELKKNNNESQELSKLVSQLRNIEILGKIDESKYLINEKEKKTLNEELVFLKDILKDKREQEEQLHKSIAILSEENNKLESNYLELKFNYDKKIKENSILQSILENYKILISDLEEKNNSLLSQDNIWKEKLKTETGNLNNIKENILFLKTEIKNYKEELEIKSSELNASLSRLGQVYVELNETKQILNQTNVENENLNSKIKFLKKENQEINDALSNQFQFTRRKDLEIESIKKEKDAIITELEREKLLIKDLRTKILELESNFSKIENEKREIHKDLNNKYLLELEKKDSLEKLTKECKELKRDLELKENEINSLKKESDLSIKRLKETNINEIDRLKIELSKKHLQEISIIEENKKILKIENENLIEETNQQKKMIQELLCEKISLNSEIISLKESIEKEKIQFENSIQILTKELSIIQEIGSGLDLDGKEFTKFNELKCDMNQQNHLTDILNKNIPHLDLNKISQSTTALSSNYTLTKSENIESDKLRAGYFFADIDIEKIENLSFYEKEASLSAQCEMAYVDILAQTERFKTLSQKLRLLEETLRKNNEKSISEILEANSSNLLEIGVSKDKLLENANLNFKTKNEIDEYLSNKLSEISRNWVIEAETSRFILENAHGSRNIAAKARMLLIEKKEYI